MKEINEEYTETTKHVRVKYQCEEPGCSHVSDSRYDMFNHISDMHTYVKKETIGNTELLYFETKEKLNLWVKSQSCDRINADDFVRSGWYCPKTDRDYRDDIVLDVIYIDEIIRNNKREITNLIYNTKLLEELKDKK